MYYKFFNFSEPPFSIAPNPRFLYMSPLHQEALAHLLFGINEGGGFIALTGEVGTGKTTLCRSLLEQLPENVEAALLLNPHLNSIELLASLCDELRIAYPPETTSLKILVDSLNSYLLDSHANGHRTVVIIDEAQNLSYGVLEQIRLLTNLETAQTKLLQIILVGQPELNEMLNKQNLRQLSQRITARYHLGALNQSETKAYIDHRLSICGSKEQLFSNKCIKLIHRRSGGIPRLINVICDRSLLGAYTQGSKKVTPAFIRKASNEVLPTQQRPKYFYIVAVPLLLTAIAITSFFFFSSSVERNVPPEKLVTQQKLKDKKKHNEHKVATKISRRTQPEPITPLPKPKTNIKPKFIDYLEDTNLTMENAFRELFNRWKIDSKESHGIPCADASKQGLSCFAHRGQWSVLGLFNRPVILEFPLKSGGKRYLTLASIKGDQATMSLNGKHVTFSVADILPNWNGFYLLLWKPKYPDATLLIPGITHPAVGWIRKTLNRGTDILPDAQKVDYFDETLRQKVMEFQTWNGLKPDGIAGPKTLIILDNLHKKPGIPTLNDTTINSKS